MSATTTTPTRARSTGLTFPTVLLIAAIMFNLGAQVGRATTHPKPVVRVTTCTTTVDAAGVRSGPHCTHVP